MEGTRPIHCLKTKELEYITAAEQALPFILWDADGDELEVLQSWYKKSGRIIKVGGGNGSS